MRPEKPEKPQPTVATNKMHNNAIKVLAKVSPLVFGMEAAMLRDKVKDIPKVHRSTMKSLLRELKKMEGQAQDTVSNQAVLSLQLTEVAEKTTAAQNHLSLFTGMLNSFG